MSQRAAVVPLQAPPPKFDAATIARWRADPCAFIEEVLVNPETGRTFELLPAERVFIEWALEFDNDGRLVHVEWVYSAPKKTGKTTFAGIVVITVIVIHGGPFAEGYCLANDFDQAQGRVF